MYEILAADDNPSNLRLLQALLVAENYKLRLATNGSTVLTSVQSSQPDLILLDIDMPEMTGYEVCRKLKEDPLTHEIPVIVVSEHQDILDMAKVFSVGAVDCVTKPFRADELKFRIRTHLKLRTPQRNLFQLNQAIEDQVKERTKRPEFTSEEFLREIKIRRQTEEALAQEKAFTSHVVKGAPTLICGIAPDGICTYLNPAVSVTTGYSEEEVLGRNWWRLFYPGREYEQVEQLFENFEKEGFQVRNYEMDLITKNGSKRTISWNSVNRFDEKGILLEVIGIGEDVTNRKKMEAALKQSEHRYEDLFDRAPDMYVSVDAKTAIVLECNQTTCDVVGLPKEEILGNPVFPLYHPNAREKAYQSFQKFLKTGEARDVELQLQRKDGSAIDVLLNASAVWDEEGNILSTRSVWRDISRWKQLELAKSKLQLAIDQSMEGVSLHDEMGRFEYVNFAEMQMYGYESHELLGKSWDILYEPTQAARIEQEYFPLLQKNGKWRGELVGKKKNGEAFDVEVSLTQLKDAQGNAAGLICSCRDITERRQAEKAIRAGHEEMQALLAGTASVTGEEFFPVLVQHLAQALHVKYALVTELLEGDKKKTHCLSIRMGDQWGPGFFYSLEDTPCGEVIQSGEAYYPDNVQALFPNDQDLIDLGAVSYKGIRLDNSQGKAIGHLAILDNKPFVDSPRTQSLFRLFAGRASAELERKMAQVALEESEEHFQLAVRGSSDGLWDWPDPTQDKAWFSPRFYELLGYKDGEIEAKFSVFHSLMHPEDRQQIVETIEAHLTNQLPLDVEFRLQKKSGEYGWFRARGQTQRDDLGKPLRMAGSIQDINDRKRSESDLHALVEGTAFVGGESFFNALVRHLGLALRVQYVFLTEILEGEPQACRVIASWVGDRWGLPFTYQTSQTPCLEVFQYGLAYYPDRIQEQFPLDQKLVELGAVGYMGVQLANEGGKAIGHLCILDDKPLKDKLRIQALVSVFAGRASGELNRQQIEESLQRSEEKYRSLFEAASDGIVVYQDECFMDCNQQFLEILGLSRDQLIGQTPWSTSPAIQPDGERSEAKARRVLAEAFAGKPMRFEWLHVRGDGTLIDVEVSLNVTQLDQRPAVLCNVRDIRERKQAEEQLQNAYKGLVDLTSRLESAKEEERKRIARELHDEFGQALSSLKWDLACLRREIQDQACLKDMDKLQAHIHSMSDLLLQTIQATRRIATSLRPPLLDDLGLIPALEWQVRDFQDRTGISCTLEIDPTAVGEPITPDHATALFRMTQELLTNVLRHAQASQIHIDFRKKKGLLQLEVQDNGIGLSEQSSIPTASLGLLGIRERVKALGGNFTIRGVPGKGTTAVVLISI